MSAQASTTAEKPREVASLPPSIDERICQFLVERGQLKENDLVRARRASFWSNVAS